MLHQKKGFARSKTIVLSVIAILLAACSDSTESANTPTDSNTPSSSLATSSSPQTTNLPAGITIPGVNNVGEINFKSAPRNPTGYFDKINNSTAPTVEVKKGNPIVVTGWAVVAEEGRPADSVIITSGDDNTVVAVAPVDLERLDVEKALKNPAYKESGWLVAVDPSKLPAERVVLKAWSYNSKTKEATPLSLTHEVVVVD